MGAGHVGAAGRALLRLPPQLSQRPCEHSPWHTFIVAARPVPPRRSLSEEEKAHLRGRLLGLLEQPDQQLAVQVAVVLSKVARHDFPRAWPALFSDLLALLAGAGQLLQRRVHLTMHHVLKELASKRLAADQRNFEQARVRRVAGEGGESGDSGRQGLGAGLELGWCRAPTVIARCVAAVNVACPSLPQVTALLLEPTWRQWAADTAAIAAELPAALDAPLQAAQQLLLTFERWLLQLKALRRMVVFGFPSDARTLAQVPAVGQVAPPLLQALQQFAGARAARAPGGSGGSPQRSQVAAMLDRAILKLLKTLRQVQEAHPW